MKVLNLYAGIGGNRKLWDKEHTGLDLEITAIEIDPQRAKIYQDFFPNDKVGTCDAHRFLECHFEEYDFIWSSIPCTKHSQLTRLRAINNDKKTGSYLAKPEYADMKLYEEIIFLKTYFKGKWVVENVISYYPPLIQPTEIQRHWFWSNFHIRKIKLEADNIEKGKIKDWENTLDFDLSPYKNLDKRTVLRNCVRPELGLHILSESQRDIQPELFRKVL
jgi:DNA (cytosine-5)-methyltransferase 1